MRERFFCTQQQRRGATRTPRPQEFADASATVQTLRAVGLMLLRRSIDEGIVPRLQPSPVHNRLLANLPPPDRLRILERCVSVDLVYAALLQEPGAPIRQVLFPTDGFVSLLTPVDGHHRMEIGLIGDEGMLGTALVLGVAHAPAVAMVQGAGTALQLDARLFRLELSRSDALRVALARYIHVVMCQLAQTVVCTRFHVVEERLARWLLMTSDRAHSGDFRITHEFLASMLGVRRAGVTRAAGALDGRQLIRYRRGEVSILDRPGLEQASCVCYATDRTTYARVLGRRGRHQGSHSVR